MGLRLSAPGERLDRVEFDPREELRDSVILLGTYRCPACGAAVEFRTGDFRDGMSPDRPSKLDGAEAAAFDAFRPLDSARWESRLDFHCPGCRSPVRLIYEPWEFAMGSYAFTVTGVVEREPAS